jgi:catechol 2,3-dioxygenase-like lactoylglutathione lyase family enzyme
MLCGMQPRVNIVTLGMPDLAAARRFYVEGLGWTPTMEMPGEIIFVQVGHGLLLALWHADKLERDIDSDSSARPSSVPASMSLAHNVGSDAEVSEVLAQAEAAGGTVLKPAQRSDIGFVHGYFADPAGFRWEVAYNPGLVFGSDGTVTFEPAVEGG